MTPDKRDHSTPPTSPWLSTDASDNDIDEQDAVEVIEIEDAEEQPDEDFDVDEDSNEEGVTAVAASDADEESAISEDNSEITFSHHKKSVFCCDLLEKDGTILALSGGEDDVAYLWNAGTGHTVLDTAASFKDSVVQVQFSHDGSYWAAADLSGLIKVWKLISGEVVWQFETSDVTCMFWHHGSNVLFAATVDSELWMWKIPVGASKVFSAHGEKVESAKLCPDGKRALVGYSDGTMRLFDLKSGDVQANFTGNQGHDDSVTVLDLREDNVLAASGSLDGTARVLNLQTGKNLSTFRCSSDSAQSTAVESVLFSNSDLNLLITGSLEGVVAAWDLSSQSPRHTIHVGGGVVKMAWRNNSASPQVLVATLDGVLRVVDVLRGAVVAHCSGHSASILDFAQTRDGNVLLTSSDDGHCKVYNMLKVLP